MTTGLLGRLLRLPGASRTLDVVQATPWLRRGYDLLVGYDRAFATLAEAEQAVLPFTNHGHENQANTKVHLDYYEETRPSDYAALFYLRDIMPGCRRLFDLGGHVGHLYYFYQRHLRFRSDFTWEVLDLPPIMARGRTLAAERRATRLRFAETWSDASGADLLLCSGAAHYLPRTLAGMVADLADRPHHVLVNRTPLTDGTPFAAVQEGTGFRVACMVRNRQHLVDEFESLGYRLHAAWHVPELSIVVRSDPRRSVPEYSGLFFGLAPSQPRPVANGDPPLGHAAPPG